MSSITSSPIEQVKTPVPESKSFEDLPTVQQSYEDLERNPPRRFRWGVKGPLYEGPILNLQPIIGEKSISHYFITARPRKRVRQFPLWKERRDMLLSLAEMFFERSTNGRPKLLEREAEGYYKNILTQLDATLVLLKCKPQGSSPEDQPGYLMDPHKYQSLIILLEEAAAQKRPMTKEMYLPVPTLPVWLGEERPQSIWEEQEAELFCVCLREDVENYLAFLWDVDSIYSGTYFGGIQTFISPDTVESINAMEEQVLHVKQNQVVRAVIERRSQVEESLNLISHQRSQLKGKSKEVIKEFKIKPEYSLEENIVELRKPQSSIFTHRSSRPSVSFSAPFGNLPSHMRNTDKMKEIFEDITPIQKKQATPLFFPETPKKYFGTPSKQYSPTFQPEQTGIEYENQFTGLPMSLGKIPQPTNRPSPKRKGFGGDPGDPNSSDDDGPKNPRQGPFISKQSEKSRGISEHSVDRKYEAYFDNKMRPDVVPEWDGDADTLASWILKINHLAKESEMVFKQLGRIIPLRLRKGAEKWFFSLPLDYRQDVSVNWGTLKTAIGSYYMNRAWLDKQKARASNASFRESGYSNESPSEYFIRKSELLRLVNKLSDSELILEVMGGAPEYWSAILDAQRYETAVEFQTAIKYHESALSHPPFTTTSTNFERRLKALELGQGRSEGTKQRGFFKKPSRSYLVGSSQGTSKPSFPKDDSNVSKKATPESKGARPCRHCGSGKHWDYECKHATKGMKIARTRAVTSAPEEAEALDEYDDLYYDLESDQESEEEVESNSYQTKTEIVPEEPENPQEAVTAHATCAKVVIDHKDIPEKKEKKYKRYLKRIYEAATEPLGILHLKKSMARPSGCAFLGATATTTKVWLGEYGKNCQSLIADSGSDITLISQDTLKEMNKPLKVKSGQKINLVQVTGSSKISGYVNLPIYFDTKEGPVLIEVEAYVVKGMTTPLILGNDFADQYSISIIREDNNSYLMFGNSGRKSQTESLGDSKIRDADGHALKIRVIPNLVSLYSKFKAHRRMKKSRKRERMRKINSEVRTTEQIVIPPETCSTIDITIHFPGNSNEIYVEKLLHINDRYGVFYGITDSVINRTTKKIRICNFSQRPVLVQKGQLLGYARNPHSYLDKSQQGESTFLEEQQRLAHTIRSISQNLETTGNIETSQENEPPTDEVQGGPKFEETPSEGVPKDKLSSEIDICSDLTETQKKQILSVVKKNEGAFGLDGRLGNYDAKVSIKLKPDAKPISLPPYNASPVNRKVIDEQMDSWIALEVIEPSKSPWGFPALISYRGGKPRMCIDYRRLNECVVPDEFPLPRQDSILQALTGSHWLSTLDALSGFTQLSMINRSRELTAFRTHRGLYQFNRMPFGYRNGPAVFQRVMQNVLAPFLWIFALVYIDDIVIYSKTFEEHLTHLDSVFKAVDNSGITLSPKKCHLGYQSLKLLGQKVSRLGLSTHKEKVDAIVNLDSPQNVKELQTFLGMMVYFSSYIPFYAWIVAPLFQLLKKETPWSWNEVQQEAFELSKQALVNSPVRAFAIPGLGYRLYSDACDLGIAAILQQVQLIKVRDLKDTKIYDKLLHAYNNGEPIPKLVSPLTKDEIIPEDHWGITFEDTEVHIERVICYWSRTLKSAERNYSPTEREALALRDGLIKFQPYIEGEQVTAITDHAALVWSRTFQNVNRRLLTWGTVFAAYPDLKIVHRAGRVHSNVDPISRLRRQVPFQDGPEKDSNSFAILENEQDSLTDLYEEVSPRFEERLLMNCQKAEESDSQNKIKEYHPNNEDMDMEPISLSCNYSLVSSISNQEIQKFTEGYKSDRIFNKVIMDLQNEDLSRPDSVLVKSPYWQNDQGLLYFEDWNGNDRLCVPESMKINIIADCHNEISAGAHAGYHRSYNRLASVYYWPRMSRDIKKYITTCDICQKAKSKTHAPIGLLQPIPIPERPFDTVTMDFITELPESNGYDSILVIVDKLTKYVNLIPTTTRINEKGTAELFFDHIVTHYGLPKQIISDRDSRWTGSFWKEVCKKLNIQRALTTAHHPQADGQTEVMNQILETALRCYVAPEKNDWSNLLNAFMLSYNNTPHSATGFTPSFLLFGFFPRTETTIFHQPSEKVDRGKIARNAPRKSVQMSARSLIEPSRGDLNFENTDTENFIKNFENFRQQAQEALLFSQITQQKNYNKNKLIKILQVGDKVLINPHSLELLRKEKGKGRKLQMKFDGPFEVLERLSPITYRLRLPASYGMHPVINIAHLEKYKNSPPELGKRPQKSLNRDDFDVLEEFEVEKVLKSKMVKAPGGRRKIEKLLTRFRGYDASYDEWLTRRQLRNAPDVLKAWDRSITDVAANEQDGRKNN
jgi:transposase InsO family protein